MNRKYMDLAFEYAEKSFKSDEVPIGAVIVKDDKVIACGYNLKELNQSVLEHAELSAIKQAESILDNWRLDDCDLYVTLDPCPMCASAIKQARIKNVYSALSNSDENNKNIIEIIFQKDHTNPAVHFESDLDVERSRELLNTFFKKQRNN